MIVRFENLLDGKSITKSIDNGLFEKMKTRTLCSVQDEIYWINKVINFDSHTNILISPLYAWECMVRNGDWSIFETISGDNSYRKRLSSKLCVRHESTEVGVSDRSGKQVYIDTLDFDTIPVMKHGDLFVFEDVVYIVRVFEVHRRLYGEHVLDRVIAVSHDIDRAYNGQSVIRNNVPVHNPLIDFIGEMGPVVI